MAKQAIVKFQSLGRLSNANPHAIATGAAQSQMNLTCSVPGEWRVRAGMNVVTFANQATAVASNIISMGTLSRPEARWVVMQLANGAVRVGRNGT